MGICASGLSEEERAEQRAAQARSKQLDQQLRQENMEEQEKIKLLFLGAGESGKSTMLKQMQKIYGKGFTPDERKTFISAVHNNTIVGMTTLCQQAAQLGNPIGDEAKASYDYIMNGEVKEQDVLDSTTAGHVKILWQDAGIQKTFQERNKFQLFDGASYFFDKVDDLHVDGFLPSDDDILRTRVRTTGIVESHFLIEGNDFLVVDVGGQRNERKKWLHCFSDVTAVLFLVALSEYDQVLFEAEDVNRMDEALALWEQISNSPYFDNTSLILFLNKEDLFREKLKRVPLNTWAEDYTGDNSFDDAAKWIADKFISKVHMKYNRNKRIYPHITTATNTANMTVVFNAVKDIIIRRSLQEGGLLNA